MILSRRSFVTLGTALAAAPAVALKMPPPVHPAGTHLGPYGAAIAAIDAYVPKYLAELGAPGLTLAIADREGVRHVASYGYADIASRTPVTPDQQFQIGSISKSFVALALLQLVDEGRVDVHDPIEKYLPGLRFESPNAPITLHHLLTHTAALPDGALFPCDPAYRHRPTGPLGRDFHYCNMGWQALGHVIEQVDQRSLAESLEQRLLVPLGMKSTAAVTSFERARHVVQSYWPARTDRPYPVHGSLVVAPRIMATEGSGCVSSTPADMGRYLMLLLNAGRVGSRRLLSDAAFTAFSTPYIAADEFGNGAHYGYGIAVDTFDGHRRLRHTGGMVSFASALEVDTDSGVGVFVSVNAMQGVRPRPVAEFALRALRAAQEKRRLPTPSPQRSPRTVADAAALIGRYDDDDGSTLDVVKDGPGVALVIVTSSVHPAGQRLPLEPVGGAEGVFVVRAEGADHDLVAFTGPALADGRLGAFGWGSALYRREGVPRSRVMAAPTAWGAYVGHYRSEDVWTGSHHIVLRAGQLWLDGFVPLEPTGDGRFWLRDEPTSPEWIAFGDFVAGRPMTMTLSGTNLERITSG